uniref:Uncharacterized protein n=1 Tax=Arundo donax TaxID=35708 RepID=A0A0A9GHK6_ARUDO
MAPQNFDNVMSLTRCGATRRRRRGRRRTPRPWRRRAWPATGARTQGGSGTPTRAEAAPRARASAGARPPPRPDRLPTSSHRART